jgi:hypothetical protein
MGQYPAVPQYAGPNALPNPFITGNYGERREPVSAPARATSQSQGAVIPQYAGPNALQIAPDRYRTPLPYSSAIPEKYKPQTQSRAAGTQAGSRQTPSLSEDIRRITPVLTGRLPEGGVVAGQTDAQKGGSYNTQPVTPYDAFRLMDFGLSENTVIYPTRLNTDQETLSMVAPYVQDALASAQYSLSVPLGRATITPYEVDLLEQAGLLRKDTEDYAVLQALAAKLPVNNSTPTGSEYTTVNSKWEPYNYGGTKEPVWAKPNQPLSPYELNRAKIAARNAARNASTGEIAPALQETLKNGSNIGPLMGLMQWRNDY